MKFLKKNKISIVIVVVVAAIAGFFFLISTGSGEQAEQILPGEYDTFAQCLTDEGMVVYGSATCSQCARQRKAFGNSFHFIREVECDPRNSGYIAGECLDDITHTPTWVQFSEDGIHHDHRFKSGFISLEDLSEQTGCPLVKDELESTS